MCVKIEIITTGDELMSGLTQDSNFSWSGDALTSRGLAVEFHTTVGDERDDISTALGIASERADAIIVSGGLGPTPDDLTTEVAARFSGVPLELNMRAVSSIEERLSKRGRGLTDINRKQADRESVV